MPKKLLQQKQKQTKKIGESTALKMKEKLGQFKQKKKPVHDEEINSVDSADEQNKLAEDPFFAAADDEKVNGETAEEKRLRLTKKIISEYAAEEKTDFFTSLVSKSTAEQEILTAEDNQITRRMKLQMLEQKGKLFYKLAADFCGNYEWEGDISDREHIIKVNRSFMKGHKQAITCLNWTQDNKYLVTGSKDCSLIKCECFKPLIIWTFRGFGSAKKTILQR